MAAVGIRVVVKIGQILWKRHRENERKQRFYRLAAKYHAETSRDMAKLASDIRSGRAIKVKLEMKMTLNRFGWAKAAMREAVEGALDAAADTAVRSAKRRVPVRTGALKNSIDRTPVESRGRGKYQVTIYAGEGLDYGVVMEFGGVHTSAQPFIRPAARAGKKKVAREVKKRFPNR